MSKRDLFDLGGRKALVTGASRGIGRALAEALAGAGAEVAITARKREDLIETEDAIVAAGGRAHRLALDVTELADIGPAFAAAHAGMGGLDILVNNAGTEQVCPALDIDEALWNRIVDTNLKGAFFCAQAAVRLMRAGGQGGAIVNLGSLSSAVGIPTAVPYTASKSGLLGMTRALAAEWAPLGIRVNAMGPGYFRTDMTEVFYADPAWQAAMQAKIPMGRLGRLDDLAGTIVYLASEASAYVTGQFFPVDGGFLASI